MKLLIMYFSPVSCYMLSLRMVVMMMMMMMMMMTTTNLDSSIGTATEYELDDRMIGVRFPAVNFSLYHRVQTGHVAPLSLLSKGYLGLFPRR
jgi:hypothetical protein